MPKVTGRCGKIDVGCVEVYIAKVPLYRPGSFWHVDGPGSTQLPLALHELGIGLAWETLAIHASDLSKAVRPHGLPSGWAKAAVLGWTVFLLELTEPASPKPSSRLNWPP